RLAAVAPHLSSKEIKSIIRQVAHKETIYVPAPPLRVDWGYVVIAVHNGYVDENNGKVPACIECCYAARTSRAYTSPREADECEAQLGDLAERAIAYAQLHWGDRLILVNWGSSVIYRLCDPRDLDNWRDG